jgi:hypothetical protein
MSGENRYAENFCKMAMACGLLGGGAIAVAADEPAPDIEFLEYLGSWEESDEDWVLLAAETFDAKGPEQKDEKSEPAPDGEKLAETDNEN